MSDQCQKLGQGSLGLAPAGGFIVPKTGSAQIAKPQKGSHGKHEDECDCREISDLVLILVIHQHCVFPNWISSGRDLIIQTMRGEVYDNKINNHNLSIFFR